MEVEALNLITLGKIKEIVYKNIVYHYGLPHVIVSDNGKLFDCEEYRKFYDDLYINKSFSSVEKP